MPNLSSVYVIHDSDPSRRGAVRIKASDASDWNEKGYGVFWTINEFFGSRKKENLVYINGWGVDIDGGDKPAQMLKIKRGLSPTMIVETKSGYQPTWKAVNASEKNHARIMRGLVQYYGADKRAKDLCRLLRMPGYYHLKDPSNPFLIKKIWMKKVEYTELEMLAFYPDKLEKKKQKEEFKKFTSAHPMVGDFWQRVWDLDCEYALAKLSGTDHVSGEVYSFKQNSGGTKQIFSNGKSTSCWIDQQGHIGSLDNGGPSVLQWLKWLGHDTQKAIEIIKKEFPECQTPQQMNLI